MSAGLTATLLGLLLIASASCVWFGLPRRKPSRKQKQRMVARRMKDTEDFIASAIIQRDFIDLEIQTARIHLNNLKADAFMLENAITEPN